MQRLLLEKELVIGARGSYGLFCQTFLKGHGTFSFPFFPPSFPNTEFRDDAHFSPVDLAHIRTGEDAQPDGANAPVRRAILHPGDVTRAKGGGAWGFILVVFNLTEGIVTLFAQ